MSIFENNRPWNNSVKKRIKNADNEEIMEYFNTLCEKWTVRDDIFACACQNLNITDIKIIDMGILQMEFEKAMYEATMVYSKFKSSVEDFDEYKSNWDRMYEAIFYSERLIRDLYLLNKTNDPDNNSLSNEDPDILFKYSRFKDDSKKTPYQCLLLYLLELFSEEGFTRCGGNLYKPLIKYSNNTHAWYKCCSIKEYIYQKTDHKVNFNQWKNAT